jgi:hypothetical protein
MWVTIRTYTYAHEAALGQLRLDSCGIGSRLRDDHSVGMLPHLGNAFGGVKLEVKESDVEVAMELLSAVETKPAPERGPYRQAEALDERDEDEEDDSAEEDEHEDDIAAASDRDVARVLKSEALELPGDPVAQRAYNASLLGFFFLPVVAHLYSASLLWDIREQRLELTDRGEKLRRRARKMNVIAVVLAAVVLAWRWIE